MSNLLYQKTASAEKALAACPEFTKRFELFEFETLGVERPILNKKPLLHSRNRRLKYLRLPST